jgi:hypothetical protein
MKGLEKRADQKEKVSPQITLSVIAEQTEEV